MYGTAPQNYAQGFEVINDSAVHPGNFTKLVCMAQSIIVAIESTNIDGGDSYGDLLIDAGAYIEGNITSVRLLSGTCIAYKL